MKRDSLWWLGQGLALGFTVNLLFEGQSGAVAGMAGYALAVLVDIRSALMAKEH
jgi:hypothetical protein